MLTSEELEAIRVRTATDVYNETEDMSRWTDRVRLVKEVDRLRHFEEKAVGAAMICDALRAENERLREGVRLAKEWLEADGADYENAPGDAYAARESFRVWAEKEAGT